MERGEYLSKVIEEKGFNVMTLSKESGVSYTTIRSMIERNLVNASLDNVYKICNVLKISIDSLFSYKNGEPVSRQEIEDIKKVLQCAIDKLDKLT